MNEEENLRLKGFEKQVIFEPAKLCTSLKVALYNSSDSVGVLFGDVVVTLPKRQSLLDGLQRQFSKMILGMTKLSYCSRVEELTLRSLEERRTRADLTEVYQMTRGLSSVDFIKFSL